MWYFFYISCIFLLSFFYLLTTFFNVKIKEKKCCKKKPKNKKLINVFCRGLNSESHGMHRSKLRHSIHKATSTMLSNDEKLVLFALIEFLCTVQWPYMVMFGSNVNIRWVTWNTAQDDRLFWWIANTFVLFYALKTL